MRAKAITRLIDGVGQASKARAPSSSSARQDGRAARPGQGLPALHARWWASWPAAALVAQSVRRIVLVEHGDAPRQEGGEGDLLRVGFLPGWLPSWRLLRQCCTSVLLTHQEYKEELGSEPQQRRGLKKPTPERRGRWGAPTIAPNRRYVLMPDSPLLEGNHGRGAVLSISVTFLRGLLDTLDPD